MLGRVAHAENLHFTYLWHLEQPIYWPDQQASGIDRYERAWESIQRTDGGAPHPENNLREIFGLDDRVAAYQYRCRDSIDAIRGFAEAGAQISYSGGLIENIQSLGGAGQLGYSSTWYSSLRQARGWTTVGAAKPRCDIVVFPFHHPLMPLCDTSAIRKEIQLYKAIYADAWGNSVPMSRGLFPPEMAFSTRLIQVLDEEGIDWVFVSGEHVSRACVDFPVILGSGGINCDPPNLADQLNPAQGDYYRLSISRGCGPAEAYPFAFTPHRAQYVNPDTGTVYQTIVVPCAQGIGWEDGYAAMGLGHFNSLQAQNNPARPMLVVLAHDGDNAWGGGYSYYMEATPNLVSSAQGAGYHATVVEEYLADHPVPANDIIHVEDGAWVNADGDFGSPVFLNWNWPLVNGSGQIDIPGGWAEDERNWAVITAAQNRVDTAEQIAGGVNIQRILYPSALTTPAERAWHYFLGALNSGYMYYGTSLDMEVKPTIACNEAVQHADAVIGDATLDATPPTIWIPQRHPWNPGSLNFGPQYGYQQFLSNGDFWVWTFVYDVSSVTSVTLKYRIDGDGLNPLSSTQNETYDGGPEVGPWQSLPMTQRVFPTGNFHNDPSINFFELPLYIADQYYVEVTDLREVLIDYYVEAIDGKGTIARSPIQHVWIGDGAGGGGPGGDGVTIDPDPPVAGQSALVTYNPAGRPLASAGQVYAHVGFNNWSTVLNPDPAMSWNAGESVWELNLSIPGSATQVDFAFNNGAGTWDSNGGQDWHFAVTGGQPQETWTLDGTVDENALEVAGNGSLSLRAGILGDVLYVAAPQAGSGRDHFIFLAGSSLGSMAPAPWAKAGSVAGWSAFVGNENDNGWSGWFEAPAGSATATGAGGYLEATIDLAAEFGTIPEVIHVAFARYATADGGALDPGGQIPQSINGNGNVDPGEFVALNTCDLRIDHVPHPADLNADCKVDQDDIAVFVDCVSGPGVPAPGTCPADSDTDGDFDLRDYARFQIDFAN